MAEQLICNQQVDGSTPFTSSSLYGGIPERPKGADCKSVVTDFAGPNPASPTITKKPTLAVGFFVMMCECYSHRHAVLLVRIPHSKIGKLACQAKSAGIFALQGEYPALKAPAATDPCGRFFALTPRAPSEYTI